MPSSVFYRALNRERAKARLRDPLDARYEERTPTKRAAVTGGSEVRVGNQRYPATGVGDVATGQSVTVRNVGTRTRAVYAPDSSGVTFVSSGGGATDGGGGGGVDTFLGLGDTPNSYAGSAGYPAVVDPGGTGLQFAGFDHALLTGRDDDDHSAYATASTWGDTHRAAYEATRLTKAVNAGHGLDGGGTLTADVDLDVDPSDFANTSAGLTVSGSPEKLAVKVAAPLTFDGSGNVDLSVGRLLDVESSSLVLAQGTAQWQTIVTDGSNVPAYTALSSLAGDGLAFSAGFDVSPGLGLTISGDDVLVDVTESFNGANAWTGTHRHEGAFELDTDLAFIGAQSITTSLNDLSLAPADQIRLDPGGGEMIFTNWDSGDAFESDDYVSQTTGWSIAYGNSGGHADFRSIYADELHVQAFIADIYMALVGALIITKSRFRLSRNFIIPATGNTGTLYVEDLEGWEDVQVAEAGDYVRLRVVDTSGGGLLVTDVWGTVSAYTDLTGGEQSWTYTVTDDGGASGETIFAGAIALDYGKTGAGEIRGVWEATVLDQAGAPYSQVTTWETDPSNPANFTTHLRLGNLDGLSGIGQEYGLWAGQDSYTYILASDSNLEAHGLRVSLYNSSDVELIRLDPNVPSIAIGESAIASGYGNTGIWLGDDGGTVKASIGDATNYVRWDGSTFTVVGVGYIKGSDDGSLDGDGLYLTGSHMGYYDASDTQWNTYMGSDGTFWLRGGTNPSDTNGLHGLHWDAPNDKLYIYGDLALNNSPNASGGTSIGPELSVADYGLINVGSNGQFSMGSGSLFDMAAGGEFEIGTQGSGAYLHYLNGELIIEGQITVEDGGDFGQAKYRVDNTSISFTLDLISGSPDYVVMEETSPYGDIGDIVGTITLEDGSTFFVKAPFSSSPYGGKIDSPSSRHVIVWVFKDHPGGEATNGGIDNPDQWLTSAYDTVTCYFEPRGSFYARPQSEIDDRVKIAYVLMESDYDGVDTIEPVGNSSVTTIGPGFIITDNLSAISADLGTVTAGSIVVGSTNKLWLNDDDTEATVALAVGGSTKADAPFKLYEDGSLEVGDATNYLNWNGSALSVKGTIYASAGSISGDLSVSGKLYSNAPNWSTGTGWHLDYNGGTPRMYIGEQSSGNLEHGVRWDGSDLSIKSKDGSVNTLQLNTGAAGMLDIDMREGSGAGSYSYGVHISDGGNTSSGVSALYHGESTQGANAIDRIFDAKTTGAGTQADGFYAEMISGTWSDFNSQGVPFKGEAKGGQPVAVFNQSGAGAGGPAVWATSDVNDNISIFYAELAYANQVAFYVDDNGLGVNGFTALDTGGGKINLQNARIDNLGILSWVDGGGISGNPVDASQFGNTGNIQKWVAVEIGGTTYRMPLFANGTGS